MGGTHQPQTIVVKSRADNCCKSKANSTITCSSSFLLVAIPTYLPLGCLLCLAFHSICKQWRIYCPTNVVWAIQMVNILSTVFMEVPDDLAERLSPLTTHKPMYHISKNFTTAILNCNFQGTNLYLLSFNRTCLSSTRMTPLTSKSTMKPSNSPKLSVSMISLRPIGRLWSPPPKG